MKLCTPALLESSSEFETRALIMATLAGDVISEQSEVVN